MSSTMHAHWKVLVQSTSVAVVAYLAAGTVETALIGVLQPTTWELAWISDVVLAAALGVAVYLWRGLRASRKELADHERAALVLQTQLSVAAEIQQRLLPELPPVVNGTAWAASLHSAGKIGGDFYDIVELAPGRWLLLVADVSGKGIPAAMALGSLRAAFRALARDHDRPARVLALLSDTLHNEWQGSPYVTGIVACFDANAGTLTCANAGHPQGIVIGRAGVRLLAASGPPTGLLRDAAYTEDTIPLERGDICIFVSDGVTEALENPPASPIDRIVAAADRSRESAQAVCDAVTALALSGTGPVGVADWNDDRTVVVLAVGDAETRNAPPAPPW